MLHLNVSSSKLPKSAEKPGPLVDLFADFEEENVVSIPALRSSSCTGTIERDKGNKFAHLGQFMEARSAFSNAARIDPERAALYFESIAQTYLVESDWFNAVRCAAIACEKSPNYRFAHFSLARALFNFGELKRATEEFSLALKLTTPDMEFHRVFETEKSEAENWRDSLKDSGKPTQFNSRWHGEVNFYETGLTVDHTTDKAWDLVSAKNRVLCCQRDSIYKPEVCEINEEFLLRKSRLTGEALIKIPHILNLNNPSSTSL